MLVGRALHNVDAKGRVFIPAKYRSLLGEKLYMLGGIGGCIRAYSEPEFRKFMEKIDELKAGRIKLRRKITSQVCDVEIDSQGRVLLPEDLRNMAEITDKTMIAGMSEFLEFWNPDRFAEVIASEDDEEEFTEEEIELMQSLGIC